MEALPKAHPDRLHPVDRVLVGIQAFKVALSQTGCGQEYMLSYKVFKKEGKSMEVVCDEVAD